MRPKLRFFVLVLILLGATLLVSACTLPTDEEDEAAKQTAIAQTVEAALPDETSDEPTATPTAEDVADDETGTDSDAGEEDDDNTTILATNTPTATPDGDEDDDDDSTSDGEDKAKFVTDVTIPDGSEFEPGEKITKTWRVQNVGDTTWTTDYTIVFKEGERLGAPVTIPMPEEVKPNEMIDLSIEFTVPSVAGEYRSDWMFKNADGKEFGTGEGYKFPIYLVIVSTEDGGGDSSDSGGISGGAKVTGATVSVDKPNFSGKCPPTITFTYTVTTSNAGKVNFNLVFTAISPSGFKFDPPPEYSVDFTGGYTVTYTYTFLPSNSVNATARVKAVGSNTFTSDPINFSINCN